MNYDFFIFERSTGRVVSVIETNIPEDKTVPFKADVPDHPSSLRPFCVL
jgi:hypothetical protein